MADRKIEYWLETAPVRNGHGGDDPPASGTCQPAIVNAAPYFKYEE